MKGKELKEALICIGFEKTGKREDVDIFTKLIYFKNISFRFAFLDKEHNETVQEEYVDGLNYIRFEYCKNKSEVFNKIIEYVVEASFEKGRRDVQCGLKQLLNIKEIDYE